MSKLYWMLKNDAELRRMGRREAAAFIATMAERHGLSDNDSIVLSDNLIRRINGR